MKIECMLVCQSNNGFVFWKNYKKFKERERSVDHTSFVFCFSFGAADFIDFPAVVGVGLEPDGRLVAESKIPLDRVSELSADSDTKRTGILTGVNFLCGRRLSELNLGDKVAGNINRIIASHREWLKRHGSDVLERDSNYLLCDMSEGTFESFHQIPSSLDSLATYYGILGAIELIDGNEKGREHLCVALDCRGWELKISSELFFRQPKKAMNLTNYISKAACLVCASDKWAELALGVLQRVERDPTTIDKFYWKSRNFEQFVLSCCQFGEGFEISIDGIKEPYVALLRYWQKEADLAKALKTVCEYHCDHLTDELIDYYPEFNHPPFDLLPLGLLLVKNIRRKRGLTTPSVSHDLVSLLGVEERIVDAGTPHALIKSLSDAFYAKIYN